MLAQQTSFQLSHFPSPDFKFFIMLFKVPQGLTHSGSRRFVIFQVLKQHREKKFGWPGPLILTMTGHVKQGWRMWGAPGGSGCPWSRKGTNDRNSKQKPSKAWGFLWRMIDSFTHGNVRLAKTPGIVIDWLPRSLN